MKTLLSLFVISGAAMCQQNAGVLVNYPDFKAELPTGLQYGTIFSPTDVSYGMVGQDFSTNNTTTTYGLTFTPTEDASVPASVQTGLHLGQAFTALRVPNGSWNYTGDVSVVFGFSLPTASGRAAILNADDYPNTNTGWAVVINGFACSQGIAYLNNAAGWKCSGGTVTDGQWHVGAVTLTSGSLKFYVDGTLVNTIGGVSYPAAYAGVNTIGAFTDGAGSQDWWSVNGMDLSCLLVWSRGLSAGEVTTASTWAARAKALPRNAYPTSWPSPVVTTAAIANNGLAPLPPMGWNSWYPGGQNVTWPTDARVRANALKMSTTGLQALGYNYTVIDGIGATRNATTGNYTVPPAQFPNGQCVVNDYIHSLGQKAGAYSEPSPAIDFSSGRHEAHDAAWFADCGVDFLKYDIVSWQFILTSAFIEQAFKAMTRAVLATNRPITLSSSSQGNIYGNVTWGCNAGYNLKRMSGDAAPTWTSMMTILDLENTLASNSQVGCWNDMDILQVGAPGLTTTESQSVFSLWSIAASPLFIGVDLTDTSVITGTCSSSPSAILAIYCNSDVIAVDQDSRGFAGIRISQTACGAANCEVWAKWLSGTNSCAIALLNRDASAHNITATFATIAGTIPGCGSGPYTTTRDLWAHSSLGTLTTSYTATAVPAHGTFMFTVAP